MNDATPAGPAEASTPGSWTLPFRRAARTLWRRWSAMPGPTWVLWFVVVVFVESTAALCYLRYLAFYTNAWDLGILQQALWTTAHDHRLLYYTAELPWNASGSFLGVHWSPILFLFVPVYAAFPSAFTLMFVQSAAIGASAFPLYALARRRVSPWIALTLASLYLVSPPILGGLLYDFHVEAFVPVTALTAWYAWESRRPRLAVASVALLLTTVEFSPLILGGIALSLAVGGAWDRWRGPSRSKLRAAIRSQAFPIAVALASVPLTILWFAFPKLVSPHTPPITQIGPLGGSIVGILASLFTRPDVVYASVVSLGPVKLVYVGSLLLAALLAWPLGAVEVFPAVPWLLVALVSSDASYDLPAGDQYLFLVVPFLFVATASALRLLERRFAAWASRKAVRERAPSSSGTPAPPRRRWLRRAGRPWRVLLPRTVLVALALMLVALPSQVWFSPASPLVDYSWLGTGQTPNAHDRALDSVLALIPPTASVSAEPDLFPQLANRLDAFPYYEAGTEYLVVDIHSYWFTVALPPPDPPLVWYNSLQSGVHLPYGVYASVDGAVLYKLDYTAPPVLYRPVNATVAPPAFTLDSALRVENSSAPYGSLVVPTTPTSGLGLWHGPYLSIPPGQYRISSWVRPSAGPPGEILLATTIDDGNLTLGTEIVSSARLSTGWSEVVMNVTVPYPAFVEVVGRAIAGWAPTVEFGGVQLVQLNTGGPLG